MRPWGNKEWRDLSHPIFLAWMLIFDEPRIDSEMDTFDPMYLLLWECEVYSTFHCQCELHDRKVLLTFRMQCIGPNCPNAFHVPFKIWLLAHIRFLICCTNVSSECLRSTITEGVRCLLRITKSIWTDILQGNALWQKWQLRPTHRPIYKIFRHTFKYRNRKLSIVWSKKEQVAKSFQFCLKITLGALLINFIVCYREVREIVNWYLLTVAEYSCKNW